MKPRAKSANVSAVQGQSLTHLNFWRSAFCVVWCTAYASGPLPGGQNQSLKCLERRMHAKAPKSSECA